MNDRHHPGAKDTNELRRKEKGWLEVLTCMYNGTATAVSFATCIRYCVIVQ